MSQFGTAGQDLNDILGGEGAPDDVERAQAMAVFRDGLEGGSSDGGVGDDELGEVVHAGEQRGKDGIVEERGERAVDEEIAQRQAIEVTEVVRQSLSQIRTGGGRF